MPQSSSLACGRDEVVAKDLAKGATDYIVNFLAPTELAARARAARHRFWEPQRPEPAEPFVMGKLRNSHVDRRSTLPRPPCR